MMNKITINENLQELYSDVYTPEVLSVLNALAHFNKDIKAAMNERIQRRADRIKHKKRIRFLDPASVIPNTDITVEDARNGKFEGAVIPHDLQRQWIQGTGPAAKPNAPIESSIRNVAYALLSGADGWMFDGEDALGQIVSMSLDNQRNLKLAIHKNPLFMKVAEQVAGEMNKWGKGFLGHDIIEDWQKQLDFTTKIFRARGLHLDDRHMLDGNNVAMAASIVDLVLYVVNNYKALIQNGSSIVLYLPKIQTAGEAAIWNNLIAALEKEIGLETGTIKVYVLVEQLEATHQLMEIRAALGKHFVGFNTGRWDYINSVSDAMVGDENFINPDIEAITMTYGYMRNYENRGTLCCQYTR
jgi:malate synthase